MISAETRSKVRHRASYRCEYCQLSEHHSRLPHHIEHIVAKQHNGSDDLANLALACHRCNLQKGPNLSGIDPNTGAIVPLFHPRTESWFDHFRMNGPVIVGFTPTGRATVRLLSMNDDRRVDLRRTILQHGLYP